MPLRFAYRILSFANSNVEHLLGKLDGIAGTLGSLVEPHKSRNQDHNYDADCIANEPGFTVPVHARFEYRTGCAAVLAYEISN